MASLVIAVLTVLLNCAKNPSTLQAFEAANAVEIIVSYIKCPIFNICIIGKIILSLLKPHHLAHEQLVHLELDPEEATYLVTLFSDAIQSPSLNSEGYSLDEILQFLINFTRPSVRDVGEECLTINEKEKKQAKPSQFSIDYNDKLKKLSSNNIELLFKSGILPLIEKFLCQNEANMQIENCLHLVYNLFHLNAAVKVLSPSENFLGILQKLTSIYPEAVLYVQWLLGNVNKKGKS